MAQLPLSNVIVISVSQSNPGVGNFNTSNLAIFTDDAPAQAVQTITFGGTAASGNFTLKFGTLSTSSLAWNATAVTIQAAINALSGLSLVNVAGSISSGALTLSQPGQLGAITLAVASANTLVTSGSVPVTMSFATVSIGWSGGSNGFAQYLTPTQVGLDFGTSSKTYAMANGVFSQSPNILAGGGQLVIIPLNVAQQTLTFSAAPASGSFAITYNANTSALINWNDTPAAIQTKVRAVAGLSQVQVQGTINSTVLTFFMNGVYGAALSLGTSTNTLNGSITITQASTVVGESWGPAITRTTGLVQYFGCLVNENLATIGQSDMLAAAAVIQALVKIGFIVSNSSSDINPGGSLDLLRTGSFTQMRGLYYGDSNATNGLIMEASYAGLGLSVNFNGSNTTTTMHLKTLAAVAVDPTITQTVLNAALLAGADTYISLQGDPCVFTSGTNSFFDQVYNLQSFTAALQVAGFNYLAQTGTKIPQTEGGMSGLKAAYQAVCQQFVTNQYLAPGAWNSSTTFGNQANLVANVSQVGYYIYSTPVALQSQTARAARQAPIVQIAAKQAGAIQSSTVIVMVNA